MGTVTTHGTGVPQALSGDAPASRLETLPSRAHRAAMPLPGDAPGPWGGRWNASEPAGQTAGGRGYALSGFFHTITSVLRHTRAKDRAEHAPDETPRKPASRRRLPDQEFQVTFTRPNGDIITQTVLITGAALLSDLPLLARLALRNQHDIETARIKRVTLITPDPFAR